MLFLTAKQYSRKEFSSFRIKTDIAALDKCLGGGIKTGKVYELVAKPGTCSTKLCMKLCLNVQIPQHAHGFAGKALYFDTRVFFDPNELKNLAKDFAIRLGRKWMMEPTPIESDLLKNVHYLDCPSTAKLVTGIMNSHKYLEKDPNIKLIVVDSISYAIRMLYKVSERTELLMELHDYIRDLQTKHNVAVVLTNDSGYCRNKRCFGLEAVLGQKHAHFVHRRIWLTDNKCFVGKTQRTKRLVCNFP